MVTLSLDSVGTKFPGQVTAAPLDTCHPLKPLPLRRVRQPLTLHPQECAHAGCTKQNPLLHELARGFRGA